MRIPFARSLLLVVAALAANPATAGAQDPTAPTGGAPASAPPPSPFALSGRGHALVDRMVRFRGKVEPADAGRAVTVELFDRRVQAWTPQATTTAAPDGSFIARWRPRHIGVFKTRAVVARGGASTSASSPELPLTVYRPALATWFGPGFYGKRTACGQELTPELVGVAHRTLPCGTDVALHYKGRTMIAPVVDRGPFRRGTDWDLTGAAAQALGFTETDRLGAVRLR